MADSANVTTLWLDHVVVRAYIWLYCVVGKCSQCRALLGQALRGWRFLTVVRLFFANGIEPW